MGEVLIKVDHVSKKFAKDLKKSLLYGLSDVFSGITRKKQDKSLRKDEFWAVKDINFEVRRGECLGLIGHNGAGKSTLLKILNGLIAPDEGSVTMYGKVGALIELGAGFNPILTGRENIYNNGAIIGFSKQEIESKFDAIVAFAELEDFIDMPVQNYSSGMKVRLGFAIAAQMEPDVLIIDEVLAVGDLGFILKCFKQIDQLLPHTAVVFVSHSMPMVARVSNQIMLMEKGIAEYVGKDVAKGINSYYGKFKTSDSNLLFDDGFVKLITHRMKSVTNECINRGDDIAVDIEIEILKPLKYAPNLYIEFRDKEQRSVAGAYCTRDQSLSDGNKLNYSIVIEKLMFSMGMYSYDLTLSHYETKSPMLRINNLHSFQVLSESQMWVPIHLDATFEIKQTSL
jgi:lipopolysaccharide transport system ATP-binding protein